MEKTRQDIINLATELFNKYGLRSVSMDDVCRGLRISKKTIYNLFKQKEELIMHVLENMREQAKKKTKEPWLYEADKNMIDVLMGYGEEFKNSPEKNRKHFIMFYDLEKYYPDIFRTHFEATKQQHVEIVNKLIEHGLAEKIFRENMDIKMMSEFLSAQFEAMREFVNNSKNKSNFHQIFSFFRDVIIRILVNEKGMDYYLTNYYNNSLVK